MNKKRRRRKPEQVVMPTSVNGRWLMDWQMALKEYTDGETEQAISKLEECLATAVGPRCWRWYAEGFKRRFDMELLNSRATSEGDQ